MLELIKKNQNTLLEDIIDIYQRLANVTLEDSSSERIILSTIAETAGNLIDQINEAGRQNFLEYMSGDLLDAEGDTRGVPRLPNQPAKTTIQFTFTTALTSLRVIPQNTIVTNGAYDFIVPENVICFSGESSKNVDVTCTTFGEEANGIPAGEIDDFGTDSVTGEKFELDFVAELSNTVATFNGAEEETDTHYRERLYLAMSRYTTQDQKERYIFDIKTEFPDVIDVAVTSVPGVVDVSILAKNVTAWTTAQLSSLLSDVDDFLQDEKIKLIDYTINTELAEEITFTASITITPYLRIGVNSDTVKSRVAEVVENWASGLLIKMGTDVVLSQLIRLIQDVDGVKSVSITAPTSNVSVAYNQYAVLTDYGITVNTPEVA